jgi:Fe-Mn family superoxide dismutase
MGSRLPPKLNLDSVPKMQSPNRREVLEAATMMALVTQGGLAMAESNAPAGVPTTRTLKPLSFDPTRLPGLSERLLVSHHENNYGGALKNLNRVTADLAQVTKDSPPYLVAALRERELTFGNSVILHELYFDNLGGSGDPGPELAAAITHSFGGVARWEELFRATGLGLGGGSGWAVLAWDFHAGGLVIRGSGHHTQALAFGAPLLVLDMYEHAYHLDYGAAAAKYLEAFFRNVRWEVVEARLQRARRADALLRG